MGSHGERFAGGHVRLKYALSPLPSLPFDLGLKVRYAINRAAFDDNRETLEILPIVQRRAGRMSPVLNPEWSMALEGPDAPSPPKFSVATKIAWQTGPGVSAAAEYFWKTEALKHFDADADRHHFLLPAIDVRFHPIGF